MDQLIELDGSGSIQDKFQKFRLTVRKIARVIEGEPAATQMGNDAQVGDYILLQ
jgi:hypothetical protein